MEEEDEHGHDEEESLQLGFVGLRFLALLSIHLPEDGRRNTLKTNMKGDEEEHEEAEEHGEEEWRFEVVGLKAGTTKITLQLLHGDHPDFTAALLIPVTVQ